MLLHYFEFTKEKCAAISPIEHVVTIVVAVDSHTLTDYEEFSYSIYILYHEKKSYFSVFI